MFGISLSGLNASQKYLDVTSNNIANVNTVGFKRSRAEFSDIYSNMIFTNSKVATGLGVVTATVAQQFQQGTLTGDTGNNLDLAINGTGFFVLSPDLNSTDKLTPAQDRTYTRAGDFEVNNKGYVVTPQGDYLQVYDVDEDNVAINLDIGSTHALQIPSTTGAPKATTELTIGLNLPANADHLTVTSFDPKDSSTYTASTSQSMHDSLGGAHTLTYYFIKSTDNGTDNYSSTNPTKWYALTFVDGNPVDISTDSATGTTDFTVTDTNSSVYGETYYGFNLTFDTSGQVSNMDPDALFLVNDTSSHTPLAGRSNYSLLYAMGGGVDGGQNVHLAPTFTQYGSANFSISPTPTDDGYSTGLLTNIQVNDDGLFQASYTNGRINVLGKVAMANFINPQGLTKIGDTQWKASIDSGEPMDKAGAYGIQGCAALFAEKLIGDYYNVMGLPLCTAAQMLRRAGIPLLEVHS